MSSIAANTNVVGDGLALLVAQYNGRPKLAVMLSAFLSQCQSIEDALQGLQSGLLLQNATGQTLDGYGALVGVDRSGLDDASYKLFILAAIAKNNGDGTLQSLNSVAQQLFEAQSVLVKSPAQVSRQGGAKGGFVNIYIFSPALPSNLWPLARKLLGEIVGGGVELSLLMVAASTPCFAFARLAGAAKPWVGGFAGVGGAAGAPFASLLQAANA